ncbi:dihydrolipoamide acetyltransferase family protein [Novosphingobium mathurense]|uniref:Dihydrolipoamide acetyltransferase component of pyruvate dehydrogenase complex n=1 Tax=Novosphingobium mathurense TaxID=428990 RepID=A0A1U6IJ18_9SPHN|nr:dihydrolipoamide acetyltransferase family protein [Novosphingobium mathurense]SLK07987.1 pyruvate dehydrogenase E2 component (dihydrolipoamide acetyltransferase) [Novosphingobium mathurense]
MALELRMPALSPTMEKGTLARWLVGIGDVVKAGDIIAEIETDKATMEYESADEGRVEALLVPDGSTDVKVGTVIATLADADAPQATPAASAPAAPPAAPAAVATPAPAPAAANPAPAPAPAPLITDDPRATPLAVRLASAHAIDLAGIPGSGPRGKIVRADLGLAPVAPAPVAALAPAPAPAPAADIAPPPAGVPVETVRLSEIRKTIARRLTQSKQTVPHFYLTARCRLDPLLALRTEINASLAATGIKISVNDILIKAMARAMSQVPEVNVQFGGDSLHRFARVDIAMAVAIDGGLITPVIRDVGNASLSAIAVQSKALAEKARVGKLLPEDWQGGTATISNLGMFGIDQMFPVINPPQALILGAAAAIEQPWKVDGQIALASIMAASASFDHRAIDGADAARFMAALKFAIESPIQLLC